VDSRKERVKGKSPVVTPTPRQEISKGRGAQKTGDKYASPVDVACAVPYIFFSLLFFAFLPSV